MRRVIPLAIAALFLACGGRQAPAPAADDDEALPTPRRGIRLNIQREASILDNGIRIISIPELSSDLVELGVRYAAGSAHGPPGKAGLAHLAEHLTFAVHADDDGSPLRDRLSGIALYHNAYTTWDSTHYTAIARADAIGDLVALEAERLQVGCRGIDEADFAREREIVRNELRLRQSGGGESGPLLLAEVYREGHPYARPVGGDERQLATITLEDVCDFIERHYVTENVIMVATGSVRDRPFGKAINDHLHQIPRRAPPPPIDVPPVALAPGRVTVPIRAARTNVYVIWPTRPRYSEDGILADLVASRLAAELRRKSARDDLASRVDVDRFGGVRAPVLVVSAALDQRHDADALVAAVHAAAETARGSWSRDDVTGAKIATFLGQLERIEPLSGRSAIFADYAQFDRSLRLFTGDLERVDAAVPSAVTKLARELLAQDAASTVVMQPSADAPAAYERADLTYVPTEHDRPAPIASTTLQRLLAEAPQSKVERAKAFELENGLQVLMFPSFFSRVATVQLVVRSGLQDEPAELAGVSQLAARLLDAPDGDDDVVDDDLLDSVMVDARVRVGDVSTVFRVSTLAGAFDLAVQALGRRVVRGRYLQKDIDRALGHLSRARDSKRSRHRRRVVAAMVGALFGEDEARRIAREPSRPLTVQDLLAFKLDHYTARNSTLIVTGTFTTDVAEAHIRDAFAQLPSGRSPPARQLQPVARTAPEHLAIAARSELVSIQIAYPIEEHFDRAHAARRVLAEMLRLAISDVRETLAASYTVDTSLEDYGRRGLYSLGADADRKRAGEALSAMRRAVAELRAGAGIEDRFAAARRKVVRELVGGFGSADDLPGQLARIAAHELPRSHFRELAEAVAGLSLDDIRALARDELAPEREVVVLLGQPPDVEAAYRAAGLEPPSFVD